MESKKLSKNQNNWRPFEEARAFVRHLSLKNRGEWLNLRIDGKMGPSSGDPVNLYAQVIQVGKDVTHTYGEGNVISIGDAVTLRAQGIDIILNTQRTQIFGVDCLSNMGIDPAQARAIVVKSSQHFYASFTPISAEVFYCLTPGTLAMDIASIPYQHIDRNKWPLVSNPFAMEKPALPSKKSGKT